MMAVGEEGNGNERLRAMVGRIDSTSPAGDDWDETVLNEVYA
jgi:hypothetical protein